jgi:hypothetical protein
MRNLLKMLTGVFTPFAKGVAVAAVCLISVAVAGVASIECPAVAPVACVAMFLVAVFLCGRAAGGRARRRERPAKKGVE